MNEVIKREKIKIENMIYEIRGKQVMLDSDLAILYECKNGTKVINQAVKRHINRFPERYMFRLTEEEYNNLRSQVVTSSLENNHGGKRYMPYVFTEQGVAMLSAVLRTEVAEEVSIRIMDAFVQMKRIISNNIVDRSYIDNMVIRHDNEIKVIQEFLNKMNKTQEYDGIFFKGQVYDSYSIMIKILNKAKKKITIIDNYIDKNLLDTLRNVNKEILIITNKYNNQDYTKYQSQYNNITLKIYNNIHDRFIILDNKELYHIGASLKDLGKKCFAINKIENKEWLNNLLKNIN